MVLTCLAGCTGVEGMKFYWFCGVLNGEFWNYVVGCDSSQQRERHTPDICPPDIAPPDG